ncbi:fungal-trans domain-containing protein [Favolaschia claudopus]|uniref:Fungal-trans domain-containing protein n=1 Tax=Favolaschia claudopus TaxID=2862362 RepID=A0AAW0D2V4_9AGAR
MASTEPPTKGPKKRRLRGSCDDCRKHKVRCDSSIMPDGICTNCKSFNSECTHNMFRTTGGTGKRRVRNQHTLFSDEKTPQKQPSPKPKDIVDGLLRQTYLPPPDREPLVQLLFEISRYARTLEQKLNGSRTTQSSSSDHDSGSATSPESDHAVAPDEERVIVDIQTLPEHMKRITLESINSRFIGKNSSVAFLNAVIDPSGRKGAVARLTRPIYWTPLAWENPPEPVPVLDFPPDDLLHHLVDLYFREINIFAMILHRPTFEKSLVEGLHHRDYKFGSVVLAVCALASKNSSDTRVIIPCEHGELSAGWKWFRQIKRPFTTQTAELATVLDLQLCCLYVTFQLHAGQFESCWLLCAMGILQAQAVGALRLRTPGGEPLTIDAELIRRCCFYLSIFDSVVGACSGRPTTPLGKDLGLPLAVDDEHLIKSDLTLAVKQPPGTPALGEYFNAFISLNKIFTLSWRTSGTPQDYSGTRKLEPETVVELDSRLNQWACDLPEHLLWNPYQENDVFFAQSAALYASFYHIQILVHRPFIQAAGSSAVKSLAICANAARSCATIIGVKCRRPLTLSSSILKAIFDCAVVLLLNISGAKRTGLALDIDRELLDVYKFLEFLHLAEPRYQNAGRLYDSLSEAMNASHLPLPSFPPRPSDVPNSNQLKPLPPLPDTTHNSLSWSDDLATLPMAVEDLSSLPIYGSLEPFDMDMLDVSVGGLPYHNYTNMPPVDSDMNTDHYLAHWLPYLSTVDEVTQAMQGVQGSFGA